jgi:hypothetical protein
MRAGEKRSISCGRAERVACTECRGAARNGKQPSGVRREQKLPLFTLIEWLIFIAAAIGCVVGIYGLATGEITI